MRGSTLWLLEPVDGLGGETKSKTWALTPGPGGDLIEDLGTHSRTVTKQAEGLQFFLHFLGYFPYFFTTFFETIIALEVASGGSFVAGIEPDKLQTSSTSVGT